MPGTLLLEDYQSANEGELKDHLHQLLKPKPAPAPDQDLTRRLGGDAATPPEAAPLPTPPAATSVMGELANHVNQVSGGGLKLIGEGLTSLGSAAQSVPQELSDHLYSLLAPMAEPGGAQPAPQAAAPTPPSDTLTNPVGTGNAGSSVGLTLDQRTSDRVRGQSAIIGEASSKTGVPASVIAAIMDTEAGAPRSLSSAGAAGFMQIMPQHFKSGEDPFDPTTNITRGAEILADNYRRFGTWDKAAAAYFGAIDARGHITGASDATGTTGSGYVARFRGLLDQYGATPQGADGAPQAPQRAATEGAPAWLDVARTQLNKPYIWGSGSGAGGRGRQDIDPQTGLPRGFDCSGYVSWVMQQGLGVDLPAQTASAYSKTAAVPADQARPGDVVFYNMSSSDPHQQHIALYVGNGQIIQAGGTERNVNIASVNAVGTPEFRRAAGTDAATVRSQVGSAVQGAAGAISPPPVYHGAMQPTGDERNPLQFIGEGFSKLGSSAQDALQGFRAPDAGMPASMQPTPSDTLTNPVIRATPPPGVDLNPPPPLEGPAVLPSLGQAGAALRSGDTQGALEQLGQAREAVATSAIGPALGALRGPSLLSNQDLLEQAGPAQVESVRATLRTMGGPPPTDDDVADYLRSTRMAFAAAGTHDVPSTRMFHGTGSDFPRPEAGRFDSNGLYGPGYYLTSDPRVAGGTVSKGRFGVNPETGRTSTYNPETGKFDTYMTGQGELVSPGYAQARPNLSITDIEEVARRAADEADNNVGYYGRSVGSDIRNLIKRLPLFHARLGAEDARTAEQELLSILSRDSPNPEALLKKLAPDVYGRGGNVRAVDVPQDMNLLDADQPIAADTLQRVGDAIGRRFGAAEGENYLLNARVQGARSWDGETLVSTLRAYLRDIPGQSLAWPSDQAPAVANKIIADAGYDGISYAGGKRIPMQDEFGGPIEHQATVVFPESLDKLRNAISGTQGGAVRTDVALGAGAAAGAGALGYQALSKNGFTAPDLSGVGDRLGEARDALASSGLGQAISENQANPPLAGLRENIANAPVLGGALGMLRGPDLLSNEEILAQAKPAEIESARSLLERMDPNQPVTDADVAEYLRSNRRAMAVAMTHVGPRAPAAAAAAEKAPRGPIDYEALANMRAEARRAAGRPPPRPDPKSAEYQDWLLDRGKWAPPTTPEDSRLNKEIAASVNNIFAIPSLVTNTVGGAVETLKRPIVTAATGDFGAAGTDLRAMGLALGDGLADLHSTFRTGIRPSRTAAPDIGKGEAFLGKDVLTSEAARIAFLRGMSGTDEFFRHINSAGAQGSRLVQLMREHPDLSQAQVLEQFKEELLMAGEKAAEQSVFATGGSGVGQKIAAMRGLLTDPKATPGQRALGAMTNVLAPFSSVPDVILTQGLKRLPGVNEAVGGTEFVRALRRGDPVAAKRAFASTALAETINLAIAAQVWQGNITGNGPSDLNKKQTQMRARDENGNPLWQPNSVRIGDRWIPYTSLGPVAVRMGAIANAWEQIDEEAHKAHPSDEVMDRIGTTAANFLAGTGETVADAWYLQTVGRLFDAFKSGNPGTFLGQQALSTAMRAVPYSGELRNIEQVVSPTVSEPRGPGEAVAARIPGLSQLATPRIDPATGEPIQDQRDLSSLVTRSVGPGTPDPVNMALATHNLAVSDAPATITQKKFTIDIKPDEQRQYAIERGRAVSENVQKLISDPDFATWSYDDQRAALQKAMADAQADAAAIMWSSFSGDELDRRWDDYQARQELARQPSFRAPVTTR